MGTREEDRYRFWNSRSAYTESWLRSASLSSRKQSVHQKRSVYGLDASYVAGRVRGADWWREYGQTIVR